MDLFKRSKKIIGASKYAALTVTDEGCALAVIEFNQDKPILCYCDFAEINNSENRDSIIQNTLLGYDLKTLPVSWVLTSPEFKLLQIDKIDVPLHELSNAARWKVKDLIDYPVNEAAIDVFPIPPHGPGGHRKILSVVVTKKSHLQKGNDLFSSCGVHLNAIDISSLALMNVVKLLKNIPSEIALFHVSNSSCSVLLCSNKDLYMVHRVQIPVERLESDAKRISSVLATELRRVYDYFIKQLGFPEPTALYFTPSIHSTKNLQEELSQDFSGEIKDIDITEIIDIKCDLTPALRTHAFLAIGGALRLVGSDE